jgi:co-chaperonin GroES (HSP10)
VSFPIAPLQDVVIVEQLTEEQNEHGIILPGAAGEYKSGRVVACGPGRVYSTFMDASGNMQVGHFVPMTVKVGDYVIFGKYQSGGEPIIVDGKKYLMCREGDLGGKTVNQKPIKIRIASD